MAYDLEQHGLAQRYLIQALRLAGTIGDSRPSYRYEREVEDFFRHSPAVLRRD